MLYSGLATSAIILAVTVCLPSGSCISGCSCERESAGKSTKSIIAGVTEKEAAQNAQPKERFYKIDTERGRPPNALLPKYTELYEVLTIPQALTVPEFNDASFTTPAISDGTPKPVVIVLHGNFDRPEWQCDMWGKVASWYGWVLCPRGVRTPWATLEENRWTYQGGAKRVSAEMMAAVAALENRFPGAVERDGMILVGFSLGAILLPEIVGLHPGMFETVFLIEGGLKQLDNYLFSMKRHGVKRIGLAMSTPANRQKISKVRKKIKQSGLFSVYVDMKGAGHNYRLDFGSTGNLALRQLISQAQTRNDRDGK